MSSSGTTFLVPPDCSLVTCSVSRNSSPCTTAGVTGKRTISASQGAARPMAFTPAQGRAACALFPVTRTSTFITPLQPSSA